MAKPQSDERIRLQYLQWDDKFCKIKPYQIQSVGLVQQSGLPATNYNICLGPEETIKDIRGREPSMSLDTHGFQIQTHQFPKLDYENIEVVRKDYIPLVETLVRQWIPGSAETIAYSWKIRQNDQADEEKLLIPMSDKAELRPPDRVVHVDLTPTSARKLLQQMKGSESDTFDPPKTRIRFINFWRPYNAVIKDCSLAMCDDRTTHNRDLVAVDTIRRDKDNELYLVLPSQTAEWYYLSDQSPNEVLLFKSFDSRFGVPAKMCRHAAFDHKTPSTTHRKSIEVRVLIISEEGNVL